MTNLTSREPIFDFVVPSGYNWLLEHGLIGFDPFSPLEPWYYLDRDEFFDVRDRWPKVSDRRSLIAFAKRQDCDDIACFEVGDKSVSAVVVIHGWTEDGYAVIGSYKSFWEWLKSVIDDIAEWVETQAER
jgi:hypothetical protein